MEIINTLIRMAALMAAMGALVLIYMAWDGHHAKQALKVANKALSAQHELCAIKESSKTYYSNLKEGS